MNLNALLSRIFLRFSKSGGAARPARRVSDWRERRAARRWHFEAFFASGPGDEPGAWPSSQRCNRTGSCVRARANPST